MTEATNVALKTELIPESSVTSAKYDGIILVHHPGQKIRATYLEEVIRNALKCDPSLETESAVLPLSDVPAGRLVYYPTGPIDTDYDDVRILKKATGKAVKRALGAKIKRPLLVVEECNLFENADLVMLLGALEALYTPIQLRELEPSKRNKVEYLGVYTHNFENTKSLVAKAAILEVGRRVACDIGDADPERMAPPKVEEYIRHTFKNTNVKLSVISNKEQFATDYPLFEAVNRAASVVERHQGRIIFLEYSPSDASKVRDTLYLVGKGVTYDTGGADVKANGVMAGMSRDKCGAAAVAGFMKIVSDIAPEDVKVVAGLSLVRNSIGSNSYVADELIKARSGAKIRIGNTDAEGRMVMADVLCKFKEQAINAKNPHLYTVATLTGHAYLAVGEGYSIVMDNGPARKAGSARHLQESGDKIGDPFEVSTVRRDDFDFHKGKVECEDVMQCNNLPSSRTCRGHQGPAAFLILASGLDKYGSSSQTPLKYSHLDIAASAGEFPDPATGAPVLALAQRYLMK